MSLAGIYISIPFCRQKCTYCNFASDVQPSVLLRRYIQVLKSEIGRHAELWQAAGIPACEYSIDTIYMGGGTPGMLAAGDLAEVLSTIRSSFPAEHDSEITIEAAPENVTSENAGAWAAAGINRVSLGVQSMAAQELRAVARQHDAGTVSQAFANLRAAGIQNISADLIAGLPHQTAASWNSSLNALLELQPEHFSVYMLEVDGESRLGREIIDGGRRYSAEAVPPEEQVVEFYSTAMERLRDAGYLHYEISNFALPGKESRHNEKYWTNAPYFGFGVDAHSYNGDHRWANVDSITRYIEQIESHRPPILAHSVLASDEKLEERFFLGLRRREGISFSALNAEFGQGSDLTPSDGEVGSALAADKGIGTRFAKQIAQFCEAGWLEVDRDRMKLTDRGVLFSNEVFEGFLGGSR